MRLLVVEDSAALAAQLRDALSGQGFAVDAAADGEAALFLGETEPYDAVVLDLGLPGKPGLAVLRDWRAAGNRVPVLVLTARDGWAERVEGLQAGADDYLGKPFHMEELVARIQALLRRAAPAQAPQLQVGKWRLDEGRQRLVDADGREQTLTATEFRLLRYFMRHPDVVHSKSHLAEHVYDFDAERDSNVIEVYVCRLRILLGNERIETRRGQGYLFRGQS